MGWRWRACRQWRPSLVEDTCPTRCWNLGNSRKLGRRGGILDLQRRINGEHLRLDHVLVMCQHHFHPEAWWRAETVVWEGIWTQPRPKKSIRLQILQSQTTQKGINPFDSPRKHGKDSRFLQKICTPNNRTLLTNQTKDLTKTQYHR